MIPNVCMTWCHRTAKCRWCEKPIEAGTPIVRVFFWHKGNPKERTLNFTSYFHPKCWIEQGLDYLKRNPYTPYKRGRKAEISDDQRRQRYLLLRRKAALEQRKRKLKSDFPDRVLVEARIDAQISQIMVEIAKVGGVPKSWIRDLLHG